MYYKLAVRNAKRSVFDYLLYITTMTILIAVMCVSNCIAFFGDMQVGFQTASLPILVGLIMVALVNYINVFMLKHRAKEFATYLLLGMEKGKLSKMFLLEFCLIGIICFLLGILAGTGVYLAIFSSSLQHEAIYVHITKSILHTFFFFVIVEILSGFRMRQKIFRLQINELMNEKRRNQSLGRNRKNLWGLLFIFSFSSLFLLLCGIVFLSENAAVFAISFISIPLLFCMFSFYKWMYAYFSSKRLMQSEELYLNNRLYRIAEMTSETKSSALLDTIFCACLFFSSLSFVFGTLLLNSEIEIFTSAIQQWMGFLQISICIIFIVIYFSILSLQQIIELKRQANNIRILHYLGKTRTQLKTLFKTQILINLSTPTVMCFALLLIGAPFINCKLNMLLPPTMKNILIAAVGGFSICFAVLFCFYFMTVYIISKRYVNNVTDHQ